MAYTPTQESAFLTPKKNHLVKVLILGPGGVGKTAIVKRLSNKPFPEQYKHTIGADFCSTKKVPTLENGEAYEFQLWDTAGQKRWRWADLTFYGGSDVVLLVWDETSAKTPGKLRDIFEKHLANIKNNIAVAPSIIFVRNKIDNERTPGALTREQEQEVIEGLRLEKEKYTIVETSAKTGHGFDRLEREMVTFAAAQLKAEQKAEQDAAQPVAVAAAPTQQKNSRSCAFFRSPVAQIATGVAGVTAGGTLLINTKPVLAWLALKLLASTIPPAAVIAALIAISLVLLAGGGFLIGRGATLCHTRRSASSAAV